MNQLLLYRISGWVEITTWLVVLFYAFQKRKKLIKNYLSLYIYIFLMWLLGLLYMILAILFIRNLFLDYFYKTAEFVCLSLFLQNIISTKLVFRLNLLAIFIFIAFQFLNAFWGSGYLVLNDVGNLINTVYLSFFSFVVMIFLIRRLSLNLPLDNTLFNIVMAIFLIFLSDLLFDYLLKFAYQEDNVSAEYNILIIRNVFKSIYLFLFIRGIKKM